jgi:phospho-N-acetylmuramoyl-pentapeptide-transferase
MLYYLSEYASNISILNVFRYVTFRAGCAGCTAFILTILFGPMTVRILRRFQTTAPDHLDGVVPDEQRDLTKRHVPTMGGILILYSVVQSIVLWAVPSALVKVFLGLLIALGLVGFLDDYKKVSQKDNAGLSARWKLIFQILICGSAVWHLDAVTCDHVRSLMLPFFKSPVIQDMGIWVTVIFGCLVLVGSSNAVNLSDGMDGLAIGCSVVCAGTYACFAYVCGHKLIADYLFVPFVPGASEVTVIAAAIVGAGLGFLWHNCNPATMFMGDTGSLAIGGAVGLIAVLVKQEILLLVVGGVFVLEAGSVILQVSYYKLTRRLTGTPKRLFLCTPFHHHLQRLGWTETQIVVRFWILALVLAAVGMATLKVR